jgi:molybdopterin-guanine dinucleotide biosynthesis protein A
MGRDKALLEIGGKTLIGLAVEKLGRVCAEVGILSADPGLAGFGQLVADLHPGCGPMSGVEAALAESAYDWNLIVPVDVPFLPEEFLAEWVGRVAEFERAGARLAVFTVDGVVQPTVLLVHRAVGAELTRALEAGRYKLWPVLEACGCVNEVLEQGEWFRNLNTPEEFLEAERRPARAAGVPTPF